MNIRVSREWCLRMREASTEISAGAAALFGGPKKRRTKRDNGDTRQPPPRPDNSGRRNS